jgi:hypothetical protein
MDPMPPSDLALFLAEIFEALKKHEEILLELSATAAAMQRLLENRPELSAEFERVRQLTLSKFRSSDDARLRSFDEMIQQFRGTS